jgi:hypothetical protein
MGAIRREGQTSEVDGSKETDNRKHMKKVDGKGTKKEK